jgi:hypothetical protein
MQRSRLHAPILLAILAITGILISGCQNRQLRKVYTEHLGQLTGTVHNPIQGYSMTGTDLGVSYQEPGGTNRLIFLFGDSWTLDPVRLDQDSSAWSVPFVTPDRNDLPRLFWHGANQFAQVRITPPPDYDQGFDQGGMNVPVEGLAIDGRHYIFFSSGFKENKEDPPGYYCCSILAATEGLAADFDKLTYVHSAHTKKFVNISAFVEEETVWLFGSGPYRRSNVYLARVSPPALIANRDAWEYYRGPNDFGYGEETAVPIVDADCVGELSVRPHPELGYLMLYNCDSEIGAPRGIHLRRADHPAGQWGPPITIFEPGPDRGYGYFMHQKTSAVGYDDGLAEPGLHRNLNDEKCLEDGWREECWGGEYGPYLVPQWFTNNEDGNYSVVYTMSTWVPYQTHLMRTTLAWANDDGPQPPPPPDVDRLPPTRLTNPDFGGFDDCHTDGWFGLGDEFRVFKDEDGRCALTTYSAEKGDDALGALYQDFTVDGVTKSLRFWVDGGEATVRLHRGHEIVRETRGRSGHAPYNVGKYEREAMDVCWNLGEYAGDTLRVAIFDGKAGDWGFIGVTGFVFDDKPC